MFFYIGGGVILLYGLVMVIRPQIWYKLKQEKHTQTLPAQQAKASEIFFLKSTRVLGAVNLIIGIILILIPLLT